MGQTKNLTSCPAEVAELVEDLIIYSKFNGSDQAADGIS